jgi:hypothetical protein
MEQRNPRDFASVLDELLADEAVAAADDSRPSTTLDYLAVADELHSGKIVISADQAEAEYRAAGEDDADRPVVETPPLAPEPEFLDTDPKSVARELDLAKARQPSDLDALRRRFAMANHPDRVAPHLRHAAMVRMQIANMLVDEAKRRASSGSVFKRA